MDSSPSDKFIITKVIIMEVRRRLSRYLRFVGVFFGALLLGMFISKTVSDQEASSGVIFHASSDIVKPVDAASGFSVHTDKLFYGDPRSNNSSQEVTANVLDVPATTESDRDPRQRAVYAPPKKDSSRPTPLAGLELLSPDLIANTVHYIWCERKVFRFENYLSFRSVITHINPERIVVHYAHYPRHDQYLYNMWFEVLKRQEYPFIHLNNLGTNATMCANQEAQLMWIKEHLNKDGGIYVHYETIFTSFPNGLRSGVVNGVHPGGNTGFFVAKAGYLHERQNKTGVTVIVCRDSTELDLRKLEQICVSKQGPYYLREAWGATDDFSKYVNSIMYGQFDTPQPQPSKEGLVPNIAHMFWISEKPMSFLFYLSCLSQIYILRVDALYLHGDKMPHGPHWDIIKRESKLHFVKRSWPNRVFSNHVNILNHMADVFKVDVMLRYGGIYTDVDAVWINPLPSHIREYEAVASYDWPQMYNTWPDYIQNGVLLGKKGAPFWYKYLESMKVFKDDIFGYNGILQAYKVYERNPQLLYLFDHLQVMCWNSKCHPTWYPGFRSANSSHLTVKDFNWKEAHTFHWTHPTPNELQDQETLLKSTGIFAEIGQHILRAAGKIH